MPPDAGAQNDETKTKKTKTENMSEEESHPIKRAMTFLIGLAWTGAVLWFNESRLHARGNVLDFVVIATSSAFGWMPFAFYVSPTDPIPASVSMVLLSGMVFGIGLLIVLVIMPHGTPNVLMHVLSVVVPWLLIGIGWLVWRSFPRIKR